MPHSSMPASLRSISDISSSSVQPDEVSWKPPKGMSQDLLKIFEKYRLGERVVIVRD